MKTRERCGPRRSHLNLSQAGWCATARPPLHHHTLWAERQPRWQRKRERGEEETQDLPSRLHHRVSWNSERQISSKEKSSVVNDVHTNKGSNQKLTTLMKYSVSPKRCNYNPWMCKCKLLYHQDLRQNNTKFNIWDKMYYSSDKVRFPISRVDQRLSFIYDVTLTWVDSLGRENPAGVDNNWGGGCCPNLAAALEADLANPGWSSRLHLSLEGAHWHSVTVHHPGPVCRHRLHTPSPEETTKGRQYQEHSLQNDMVMSARSLRHIDCFVIVMGKMQRQKCPGSITE